MQHLVMHVVGCPVFWVQHSFGTGWCARAAHGCCAGSGPAGGGHRLLLAGEVVRHGEYYGERGDHHIDYGDAIPILATILPALAWFSTARAVRSGGATGIPPLDGDTVSPVPLC